MRTRVAVLIGGAGLTAALGYGCDSKSDVPTAPAAVKPSFTASTGGTSTLLGRATFTDPDGKNFRVRRGDKDWRFEMSAKPGFDLAVQHIVFQPGGQSGWHTHPGPVLITVLTGTVTFYMGDDPTCTPIVKTAGESYLDLGEHPHIARNESNAVAENLVTYFAPPGATLRIDQDAPGNCPF
jgi:mannose-6-phosphate isomerase-like protein (cupin superfamily)